MPYQVLARKWRPQDFASLVGQEPIVTALRNALREGRIAQAYLFSGIRGVGKTTAARVLAKALNCENGPAADPCNHCSHCLEITQGADLDVIEVDAATYSKVEQIRELTDRLQYGPPAHAKYKVVVLDEVHRLSRQAFDALLKIVEEPPPRLVFIFATTEIEAVPATILSRCQEFHFRRVPAETLVAHLRQISDAEAITASDVTLRLIARAGEGSVRDSVALLDQMATFSSGVISDEDANRMLGGLDTAFLAQLLAAILAGDSAAVVAAARRMEDEGWDPRHLYGQFLAFCRDALHLALGGEPSQIDLPLEEARALAAAVREPGYENLLRLLNQLLAAEMNVRRSESSALAAEIAWLRAAELPKLIRIEALLNGTTAMPAAAPAVSPSRATSTAQPVRPPAPSSPAAEPIAAPAPTHRFNDLPPRPRAEPPRAAADPTQAFLEEISKRKQPLAAHLAAAEKLSYADGRLTIVSPPGDAWLAAKLEQTSNRAVLEEALAAVWGPDTQWDLAPSQGSLQSAVVPSTPSSSTPVDVPPEHPGVQTILDIFGGRIQKVEDPGS